MSEQRVFDRRGFLKGSALFAAAGVLAALPASAQEPAAPAPAGDAKKEEPAEKKPDEAKPDEKKKGALYDKQGREYRVCDMCGGSMYVEEKRWTCEQCGFSYEV